MKRSKNKKWLIAAAVSVPLMLAGVVLLQASDHGDAPAISGKSTDITDLYAFQSPSNSSNLVLIGNVHGLLSPEASKTATFDENTLIEFKIDNNNDFVEDLVIQCVAKDGKMYIYGPLLPKTKGAKSTVSGTASVSVDITPYGAASPKIATVQGISAFAGPRDDPFFFDLPQYLKVVTGVADHFNNPGSDALAGTNVLSVVVELPKSLLKGTDKINVWLETKQKS
ncbi:protein of unknown function [bacterium A37T11]|nr:protein of unknown function [bacterium A37T11]